VLIRGMRIHNFPGLGQAEVITNLQTVGAFPWWSFKIKHLKRTKIRDLWRRFGNVFAH